MRQLMRMFALAVLAVLPAAMAQSQSAEQEVMKTVRQLFDGMRKGDSAMVRAAFHPDAVLQTTAVRNGQTVVGKVAIDQFVRTIGTPRPEALDERIWNEKVFIDGPLAVVWTDYALFIGARFSHCGVDAFQLAKMADGWKIIALADTRRTEGCQQGPG
ncbi:MAG: nuclear transport factor 2 family protein [Gemmatimonadaceae bacterium]